MICAEDARKQINDFIIYCNEERIHSSIYYSTPKEVFDGKMAESSFTLHLTVK